VRISEAGVNPWLSLFFLFLTHEGMVYKEQLVHPSMRPSEVLRRTSPYSFQLDVTFGLIFPPAFLWGGGSAYKLPALAVIRSTGIWLAGSWR